MCARELPAVRVLTTIFDDLPFVIIIIILLPYTRADPFIPAYYNILLSDWFPKISGNKYSDNRDARAGNGV